MRLRPNSVPYMLPRRPLASVVRLGTVLSRARNRRLSFTPLALVFRQARRADGHVPMPHRYQSRDGKQVIIAPRVEFNIRMTLELRRATTPFPDELDRKDYGGAFGARRSPGAILAQDRMPTPVTAISTAIFKRYQLAVSPAARTSAGRARSKVLSFLFRSTRIESSPQAMLYRVSSYLPPTSRLKYTRNTLLLGEGFGIREAYPLSQSGTEYSDHAERLPTPDSLLRYQQPGWMVSRDLVPRLHTWLREVTSTASAAEKIVTRHQGVLAATPLELNAKLSATRSHMDARFEEDRSRLALVSVGYSDDVVRLKHGVPRAPKAKDTHSRIARGAHKQRRSIRIFTGEWTPTLRRGQKTSRRHPSDYDSSSIDLLHRRALRAGYSVRDDMSWIWPSPLQGRFKKSPFNTSAPQTEKQRPRRQRLPARDLVHRDSLAPPSPQRAAKGERVILPVEVIYREGRATSPPAPRAPPVPTTAVPEAPKLDIERLTADIERQLEKRIRIERQRRGQL
jgi:hypothetical protein